MRSLKTFPLNVMALSPTSFNVLLHPDYVDLQESVYQSKGQEGYGPLPLRGREVLEGQVIALVPGYSGEGVPCQAYPDAAGMPKDASLLAHWMQNVKWVVNQRRAFLERTEQPMDVTAVPSVREIMLHTGSEVLRDGEYVYLRFPTDDDIEAQRCALSDCFSGSSTSQRPCPPMFATYGVAPGTVDHRARMFECMDQYRRYLTSSSTDLSSSNSGEHGTVAQIELSKVAYIARLFGFLVRQLNSEPLGEEIKKLAESIEPDAAGENVSLSKCRESHLFTTSQGVRFTSQLLALIKETDWEMFGPRPIGKVLQSAEPGRRPIINTGERAIINLFHQ